MSNTFLKYEARRHPVFVSQVFGFVFMSCAVFAEKQVTPETPIEDVYIYGEQKETDTATKLSLTLFETPQTITAISRVQMDDFALHNVNRLLDYTPGVTVEEVETDRTYYTARGFDIVNFQYDGIGIPFIGGVNLGQQDTAIYEKVEVVKGAAGLITGLANPSATVNYIRKRPTEALAMSTALSVNEWSGFRVDADVSGSLSGSVRGRVVAAYDDTESYLDRHQDNTRVAYGVFEFDLSPSTLLTVGHSYNASRSDGVLWGALPLSYVDGTRTDYAVSTSNAPDWTFADHTQNQSFAEFKQMLGEHWSLNAIYTHNDGEYDSELFYVWGVPNRQEVGLNGWASAYDRKETQDNIDLFVSGDFSLFSQEHQAVLGYSHSDTELSEASFSDNVGGFPVLGSDWAEGNTPRPDFVDHDPTTQTSAIELRQRAVYMATRFNLTDRFSVITGARQTDLEQEGVSYGGASDTDANRLVPYYGATFLLFDHLTLYSSYSEVFKQQTWVNADYEALGPNEGSNSEVGLKKTFNDSKAILTFAVFQSEQKNLGEFVGRDALNIAIYEPRKFDGEGFEVEFSGELVEGLNIGAGFTHVDLKNDEGEDIRPYVPEQLAKLSASYRIPGVPALKLGGVFKWQDTTTTESRSVEQGAYTLLDLAAQYDFTEKLTVSVNIENVTDEKYLNSLYWEQAFYGAPRNVQASVRWKY